MAIFGDTSRMYYAGTPSPAAKHLCDTTYEAMVAGIRQVKPGATLGDVGHAIQTVALREGFTVVREYCGHGIGRVYHEDPQVLHYGQPGAGLRLKPGLVFTIEPMINAGGAATQQSRDGWTVTTKGPIAFGAMGTHGHGDRRWLRVIDAVARWNRRLRRALKPGVEAPEDNRRAPAHAGLK